MNITNIQLTNINTQPKIKSQNYQTNAINFKGDEEQVTESRFPISIAYFCKNYVEQNRTLSPEEKSSIQDKMNQNRENLRRMQEEQLELGRILEYDKMSQKGFTPTEITNFIKEDNYAIQKAKDFTTTNISSRDYMFGYPVNISEESPMVNFFKNMETQLSLINNCGDTNQIGNNKINCKIEYEQPLLNKFFKYFGVDEATTGKRPWGYVTGGGSESNRWGITNGLRKYPDARVYYSEGAHYSVEKAVAISPDVNGNSIDMIKHAEIPTEKTSEKIDVEKLTTEIEKNWEKNKEPAVLLLTWGTTKTGAIDDVSRISTILNKKQIPHYIHLDAALSGGIAKNQTDAPIVPNIETLGVDSVSVSLHKYFGGHEVKSIVVAKEEPLSNVVDYIGVKDSTTAGSRGFSPFSTMQRVVETLERKSPEEYSHNINFFEQNLIKKGIPFSREDKSNTFVIDKPSDEICQKYQLSVFKDDNGNDKSHVIIFPHHKENIMDELANNLANEIKK